MLSIFTCGIFFKLCAFWILCSEGELVFWPEFSAIWLATSLFSFMIADFFKRERLRTIFCLAISLSTSFLMITNYYFGYFFSIPASADFIFLIDHISDVTGTISNNFNLNLVLLLLPEFIMLISFFCNSLKRTIDNIDSFFLLKIRKRVIIGCTIVLCAYFLNGFYRFP